MPDYDNWDQLYIDTSDWQSPQDRAFGAFVTMLGIGAISVGGNVATWGGGAIAIDEAAGFISWEVSRLAASDAIELAARIAAQTSDEIVFTAEELESIQQMEQFLNEASEPGSFMPPNYFGSY
jgi:hypothetical protein